MLIATFNVENMLDRANAMNGATWAEGKPALEVILLSPELFGKVKAGGVERRGM